MLQFRFRSMLPAIPFLGALVFGTGVMTPTANAQDVDVQAVVDEVNKPIEAVTDRNKSYQILFDAYLDLSPAPSESGRATERFNLNTIHPEMDNWAEVRDWAESNKHMADAILSSRTKLILGLPYGDRVDSRYRAEGLYADIAIDNNFRDQDFAYLDAIDTIAAYATAECYRLLEVGASQEAVDLATAQIYVNDQLCEQWFLTEKLHAFQLQIDFLRNWRDMMYLYESTLSIQQLSADSYQVNGSPRKGMAYELPWLRIDLIEMPIGDYEVAKELLASVFAGDEADPQAFVDIFAKVQSTDAPLTRFGAAKNWRMIAAFHASRIASEERLQLVFDDWWRRWKVRPWSDILDIDPQYDRTNPVRFAAVTFAMEDIDEIFELRRQLTAAVNGTAMSAGLLAYKKQFGNYPDDLEKIYATFVRKRFDVDPFSPDGESFGYRYASSPVNIVTTLYGFVPAKGGILWSRGVDLESSRGEEHSPDGLMGDIVFWPALRAIARSGASGG